MHFVKSLSLVRSRASRLVIMIDIYRLHCPLFLDELNLATSWMQSWDSSIHEEENINIGRALEGWHQGGLLHQGGVQERKPLALWLFGPNLVRPVVPVTLCEVGIYIRFIEILLMQKPSSSVRAIIFSKSSVIPTPPVCLAVECL